MRDVQGGMIFAYTIPLGIGTNNQTEVQAAIFGIDWCVQHGYKQVILEVDFELLTHWLTSRSNPPWKIQHYIRDL